MGLYNLKCSRAYDIVYSLIGNSDFYSSPEIPSYFLASQEEIRHRLNLAYCFFRTFFRVADPEKGEDPATCGVPESYYNDKFTEYLKNSSGQNRNCQAFKDRYNALPKGGYEISRSPRSVVHAISVKYGINVSRPSVIFGIVEKEASDE